MESAKGNEFPPSISGIMKSNVVAALQGSVRDDQSSPIKTRQAIDRVEPFPPL
jgi:hypothetical protein